MPSPSLRYCQPRSSPSHPVVSRPHKRAFLPSSCRLSTTSTTAIFPRHKYYPARLPSPPRSGIGFILLLISFKLSSQACSPSRGITATESSAASPPCLCLVYPHRCLNYSWVYQRQHLAADDAPADLLSCLHYAKLMTKTRRWGYLTMDLLLACGAYLGCVRKGELLMGQVSDSFLAPWRLP